MVSDSDVFICLLVSVVSSVSGGSMRFQKKNHFNGSPPLSIVLKDNGEMVVGLFSVRAMLSLCVSVFTSRSSSRRATSGTIHYIQCK